MEDMPTKMELQCHAAIGHLREHGRLTRPELAALMGISVMDVSMIRHEILTYPDYYGGVVDGGGRAGYFFNDGTSPVSDDNFAVAIKGRRTFYRATATGCNFKSAQTRRLLTSNMSELDRSERRILKGIPRDMENIAERFDEMTEALGDILNRRAA